MRLPVSELNQAPDGGPGKLWDVRAARELLQSGKMTFPTSATLAGCCALLLAAVPVQAVPAAPAKKPDPSAKNDTNFKPPQDETVRLQIFLDEQNFGPGKIDGAYGGFTRKSWLRYQEAQGKQPDERFDAKTFASVDPIYTSYTVAKDDLGALGVVPKAIPEQAKNKVLPYETLSELLGERYHVGVDFLKKINAPKNIDTMKEGDKVKVPNVVPPFNLAQVIAIRTYTKEREQLLKEARDKAKAAPGATPAPGASPTPSAENVPAAMPGPTVPVSASPPPASEVPAPAPAASPSPDALASAPDNRPVLSARPANDKRLVFHVSTKDSYLEVHDGERLVACFPITPGSTAIPTPKGEWHVVAKTLLPEFRWDKSVLMTGKRSDVAYQLPPGPNNPVGITWIALDKPGIGMHGTATPDTIGRSASHGCIRLSNWDAFKVYGMVTAGTKVIID